MSTDTSTTEAPAPRQLPVWPVWLLAAPAAVAIWSGWVGLGAMTGFGVVHPLPGIADGFAINSAITLPIGMEAYAAYALRAWMTPGVPERARRFARGSAIGALALGALGQVAYHLMAAAGWGSAPWPVTALVACLPVGVLGMGAGLAHLLRAEPDPAPVLAPHNAGYPESDAVIADDVALPAAPEQPTPAVPESQTPEVRESGSAAVLHAVPAPVVEPAAPEPTETPDARVRQLAEHLGAGAELTGQTAGELLGCSARTGRRLLREAEAIHASGDLAATGGAR